MIGLIDLGISNIFSIYNALRYLGCKIKMVNTPKDFKNVKAIILPGVGTLRSGMYALKKKKLIDPLNNRANDDLPILGICLGMQMLATTGDEGGDTKCLNLIKGKIKKLEYSENYQVPNIGWCDLLIKKKSILFENKKIESFYFLHSYFFQCSEKSSVVATIKFANKEIPAVVNLGNIFGIQYHPEKSYEKGIDNINRFINFIR